MNKDDESETCIVAGSAGLVWSALPIVAQQPSPVGVWRWSHISWVYAPKDLGLKERSGISGILRFSPDGTFTLIYAAIVQQNGFPEQASEGDSWTIYRGTWRRRGVDIEVTYSLLYADIYIPRSENKTSCPPPSETKVLHWRSGHLMLGKIVYQRSAELETSVDKVFPLRSNFPPLNCAIHSGNQK